LCFFFSSRRRHTRCLSDWSSDVCSSDLRVLLTNDTGPMHVAAALGTPVVVPFGSTSSELTGPGLPGEHRHHLLQSDAPCSPCFQIGRASCRERVYIPGVDVIVEHIPSVD